MRAVMLDVPAHLLAERQRLGHDHHDEMWEGELHMVPPASEEHQRIGTLLVSVLVGMATGTGRGVRYETGIFDPAAPDQDDYRVPDLVVFDRSVRSDRGVEGAAAMAVEIASPGDESLEKLPFYERVGVEEYLIIDRDTKALRYWTRVGEQLVERDSGDGVRPGCLPVVLRTGDGRLHVETPEGDRWI